MKKLREFWREHRDGIIKFIAFSILFILFDYFFIPIRSTGVGAKGYGILLDSDELNIYAGDSLICTVDDPMTVIHTYDGRILVMYTGNLGITRPMLKELYTLEFMEDGRVISRIKIMTPRRPESSEKLSSWKTIDGYHVILCENNHYFSFGQEFLDNLSLAIRVK